MISSCAIAESRCSQTPIKDDVRESDQEEPGAPVKVNPLTMYTNVKPLFKLTYCRGELIYESDEEKSQAVEEAPEAEDEKVPDVPEIPEVPEVPEVKAFAQTTPTRFLDYAIKVNHEQAAVFRSTPLLRHFDRMYFELCRDMAEHDAQNPPN